MSNKLLALLGCVMLACSAPASPTEDVTSSSDQLKIEVSPLAISTGWGTTDPPIPAGIAAAEKAVFVGSPMDGRVIVLSRHTRQKLAELPQPPGNFVLPLILHMISPTRVAVLDCGGFPAPGVVDAEPRIYEYEFTVGHNGTFHATLARTVSFTGLKIGFAEEFAYLGNGEYLLPDAVYGSIWHVKGNGTVEPAITPKTFAPQDAIPQMVYCPTMPQVVVGGLPFLFTDSTIPGVAGIAVKNGTVYFYSSCSASLYRIPFASLTDGRQPWQRAADITLIGSKPPNVQVEELLDMQFNPNDPSDKYLYAADALQLRMIRIDPKTGKREVLGDDPVLFDFPSSFAWLPPSGPGGKSSFLVLSNQQHRSTLLNSAIPEDLTTLPYLITQVRLRDDEHGCH